MCNVFQSFCLEAELAVLRPPGEGQPDKVARSAILQKLVRFVKARYGAAYEVAIAREPDRNAQAKMTKKNWGRLKKRKLLATAIEDREKELKKLKVPLPVWDNQPILAWRKAFEESRTAAQPGGAAEPEGGPEDGDESD